MIRWFVRSVARIYYPRIEVTGAERIPRTGAVLLCANHPNSLLDPVVLGSAARRPVKFFAKAPLFKIPVLGPLMTALGMIPAFRGVDDRKQVRRNLDSLDRGIDQLLADHAVGIFPEGKSHDNLQVDRVRGGAARMAMQAAQRGAKELKVVPVGINYQRKEQFRSSVWIQVAAPISMKRWLQHQRAETENDRQLARRLTNELQERLQGVTIHLDRPEWQPWLDDLDLLAPEIPHETATRVPSLWRRKRIADAMNHFLTHDEQRALEVGKEIQQYRDRAQLLGLRPGAAVLQYGLFPSLFFVVFRLMMLLLLFLPALLGTLFHLIPFWAVRWIARLFTPPGRTAVSLYRLLVGLPFYVIWYAAAFCVVWLVRSSWVDAALIGFMPLLGLLALDYWRAARTMGPDVWFELVALFHPADVRRLIQQRRQLSQHIAQLARQFEEAAIPTAKIDDGS